RSATHIWGYSPPSLCFRARLTRFSPTSRSWRSGASAQNMRWCVSKMGTRTRTRWSSYLMMMASGDSRHSRIGLRASLTLLALLWSCEASGFFRGVVVDAETNDRLAGVVLVVLWQKKPVV